MPPVAGCKSWRSFSRLQFLVLAGLGMAACAPELTPAPVEAVRLAPRAENVLPEPNQNQVPLSEDCVDDARFVEDLTVPDGSLARPGEKLDKRWAVLNAGTCDWGAGYRLVRTDESSIEAREELALYPARPGETAIWQIEMTAPQDIGQHIASWQARSPDGNFFGERVFVLIEVALAAP